MPSTLEDATDVGIMHMLFDGHFEVGPAAAKTRNFKDQLEIERSMQLKIRDGSRERLPRPLATAVPFDF